MSALEHVVSITSSARQALGKARLTTAMLSAELIRFFFRMRLLSVEHIIVSPAEHNLILTLIGRRHGDEAS